VKYAFIRELSGEHAITRLCSALGVSRSGYHEWLARAPSARARDNDRLLARIEAVHKEAHESYGALRTWRALRRAGEGCGRHRVARVRRAAGIEAKRKRRFRQTVERHVVEPPAPNLLKRDFDAAARDRVWVGDTTAIATRRGWLFLAVLIDLFSRKVVGWAMAERQTLELSLGALRMALDQRKPGPGLVHHTDQGSIYASPVYREVLARHGARASMSRKGNAWDNAVAESFFSSLKNELVHHCRFADQAEARGAVFAWIEGFYNRRRIHSTLDFVSPSDYEARYQLRSVTCPENRG
jgi:transposase InsO family protein